MQYSTARNLLLGTALQTSLSFALALPAHAQPAPNARPTGGVVVGGSASISQTSNNTAIINMSTNGSGTLGGTTGTVTITGTDSADNATGTLQITVTN